MLTELHVENLGIMADVTVTFGSGLVVITGETGAGKTMLISALQLLAGQRADASVVRHGELEARVDGRFVDGDEEWVLSRVIPIEGRSRGYINGRPASAGELAAFARQYVDLHGQHNQQSLLQPEAQRALLDTFGSCSALLSSYREARQRWLDRCAERDALGGDPHARARELELLRFQADEIDAAQLESGEDAHLEREEELLAHAFAHQESLDRAYAALQGAATDALGIGAVALTGPFAELGVRAHGLQAEVADLADAIRASREEVVVDPARLEEVRHRRQRIRELQRKYGETIDEILAFRSEISARLTELETAEVRAAGIDEEIADAESEVRSAAGALTDARTAAAAAFAEALTGRLPDLAMPNAQVAIRVHPAEPGVDGADEVVFELAANAGEPLRALMKTASGGELSRAMLAIRGVLGDRGRDLGGPTTLVFDEIDAGIGGETGLAIGRALRELAAERQVVCVTHLAQVAAAATTQLVVTKEERDGRTLGSVDLVFDDTRVGEIARMLGGTDSDSARRHARELLDGISIRSRP